MAERLGHNIYDRDLGNLNEWEQDDSDEITVTVTAPKVTQKQQWIERAQRAQREPRLYCIWVSRMVAHFRAEGRDQRNTKHTFDWIEYWFKHYTRHPIEDRIQG